jgi:alcohol dehydrogenase class IV
VPEQSDPKEQLPAVLIALMRDVGIPNGISGVGYGADDVADLVPGTMKQQRLLATCPRPAGEEEVAAVLRESLVNW